MTLLKTDLSGKTALITGASSGIGRGVAKAFAECGAKVVINYPTSAESASANEAAEEIGPNAVTTCANVSVEDEVTSMINFVLGEFGQLDILVNNAGIARSAPVENIPTSDWNDIFSIHVNGTFFCTRAVLNHMYERNSGRIINTASQLAYKGAPGFAHYTAAKGAILSFTRSLALEIGDRNITANCVAPGATMTPILGDVPENILNDIQAGIPRGKLAEVDDIVGSYVFLASDASEHIRGQCLSPNGGDVFL